MLIAFLLVTIVTMVISDQSDILAVSTVHSVRTDFLKPEGEVIVISLLH